MRISRIFRKYSRVLLLVFMSILLVVFLVGDVISSATQSRGQSDFEVGMAFGEPIMATHLARAENDFEIAARLGFNVPWIGTDERTSRNLVMYLLIEEARRAGIVVPQQAIVDALKRNPDMANLTLNYLRSGGRSVESIYEAAGRVLAVVEYFYQYQVAAVSDLSLPELEHQYRNQNEEAKVLISVIDANAFLDKVPEPTDEEILAYYEECKDRDPTYNDEERIDGYRVGDRIRVEYLTIDPRTIEEQVRISAREVQRYFEENQGKYTKEVDGPQFTLEENAPPQRVPMTFEEAKEQVRRDCRADKAVTEAQRLMNLIQQEARRPWDTTPLDENQRRVAPSEGLQIPFEQLQQRFSGEYAVAYQRTELLTASQLRIIAGLGTASTTLGRRSVTAAEYAFHLEGLAEAASGQDLPLLRLNEPSPLMITPASGSRGGRVAPNQAFIFRVVEFKPAGPPDSIDDVRERLVTNLKQQRALQLAENHARALAERAREAGLRIAVEGAEELRELLAVTIEIKPEDIGENATEPITKIDDRYLKMLDPVEPTRFTRQVDPRLPNLIGGARLLHERIFASPEEGGPDPSHPHRVLAVPKADRLRWIVAELEEVKPLYREDFNAQRPMLESSAMQMQSRYFMSSWFDATNIKARAGYVSQFDETAD